MDMNGLFEFEPDLPDCGLLMDAVNVDYCALLKDEVNDFVDTFSLPHAQEKPTDCGSNSSDLWEHFMSPEDHVYSHCALDAANKPWNIAASTNVTTSPTGCQSPFLYTSTDASTSQFYSLPSSQSYSPVDNIWTCNKNINISRDNPFYDVTTSPNDAGLAMSAGYSLNDVNYPVSPDNLVNALTMTSHCDTGVYTGSNGPPPDHVDYCTTQTPFYNATPAPQFSTVSHHLQESIYPREYCNTSRPNSAIPQTERNKTSLKIPHKVATKCKSRPARKRSQNGDQRHAANIRERRRMTGLNSAFNVLKESVPTFSYEKKISRIETLRLASTYITFMTQLLDGVKPDRIRLAKPNTPGGMDTLRLLSQSFDHRGTSHTNYKTACPISNH